MKYSLSATVALVILAGCDNANQTFPSFFSEAGAVVDAHQEFGSATTHNAAIQNGSKSYTVSLAKRFAEEVQSTVNFAFNSSQLDENARATLRQQATWIRQFPEIRFRVYGHTDAVGSNAFNKRLGMRRARAAVSYLSTLGINRSRLEAVVSFGETQPLIVTQGRERRNRRTVTEVSGFVEANPNLLDGKYAQIIYREYITSGVPLPTGAVPTINASE
ncbi:hypothetical protein NBRC116601_15930 [Cognatishimia sp. WU-CL00825]|uniref:OmpA family protein n=1 Tax=Cognatishimia sp. WU-CL00825 TaxID=3127658 RepID=UPI00310401EC